MEIAPYLMEYANELPISICVIKVIRDEENQYQDIKYRYANRIYAQLEGLTVEEMVGKSFFELFHKDDNMYWLEVFGKTAYDVLEQKFIQFIPTVKKYFQISTHKLKDGFCGCLVEDVTEKFQLLSKTEKQRELTTKFLRSLTDTTFFYDEKKRLFL